MSRSVAGPGLKPRTPSRSSWPRTTDKVAVADKVRSGWLKARVLLLAALLPLLAACASRTAETSQGPLAAVAGAEKPNGLSPAQARQHARILAAYGGAYEQPELEAYVAETVDRLVAASERPDVKYRITILN